MTTDTPLTVSPLDASRWTDTEILLKDAAWSEAIIGLPMDAETQAIALVICKRMARHVLATLHADDHTLADEEWFAGLPGAKSQQGAGTCTIEQWDVFVSVENGPYPYVRIMNGANSAVFDGPTRGQVRLAVRSMGHTLQETATNG